MDKNFNPRTHRGVRQTKTGFEFELDTFQSTHPSWGATFGGLKRKTLSMISIHAPIVGCDSMQAIETLQITIISIHAPIVGCDGSAISKWNESDNFNPRTHRGVRL